MVDYLLLRTFLTWGIFLLGLIIFFWSRRWTSFFIALYGGNVLGVRMALLYGVFQPGCVEYQIFLTLGALWIFIALLLLALSIFRQVHPPA